LSQVRFALTSSPVFSRTDTATDSEHFYNSILDLFNNTDEQDEVNDLIAWWNRYLWLLFQLMGAHILQANLSHVFIRTARHLQKQCTCEDQRKARGIEGAH
jgi:hypothetical protein